MLAWTQKTGDVQQAAARGRAMRYGRERAGGECRRSRATAAGY